MQSRILCSYGTWKLGSYSPLRTTSRSSTLIESKNAGNEVMCIVIQKACEVLKNSEEHSLEHEEVKRLERTRFNKVIQMFTEDNSITAK